MQRNILKLQKNSAAASTLPGMIAPSVFSSFSLFFFALLLSFRPPHTTPRVWLPARCEKKPYLDLMTLQMPFFMLNNNSVLIDTQLSASYLDTNRLVCHAALSHQFQLVMRLVCCLPNRLSVQKPPRVIRSHLWIAAQAFRENWVAPIIACALSNVQDFFVHKSKPGINHTVHPHFYWLKPFPCLHLLNCPQNKEQLYILSCQNVRSFYQGQAVLYNGTVSLLLKTLKGGEWTLIFLYVKPAMKSVFGRCYGSVLSKYNI